MNDFNVCRKKIRLAAGSPTKDGEAVGEWASKARHYSCLFSAYLPLGG